MIIDKPLLGEDIYLDPSFADGLVGCWLFNEGGGNKVFDLSGNGNTGTLVGDTSWTAGKFGPALSFDGDGDYVDVGDIDAIENADVTFSFWVKVNVNDKDACFITKGTIGVNQPLLIWYDDVVSSPDVGAGNTDTLSVLVYDGTIQHWIAASSGALGNTNWHHIVVVIDNTNNKLSIYIDGKLNVSNTKVFNGIQANATTIRFGSQNSPSATKDLNGLIDHVTIFNRVLSYCEIQRLYREPFWGFRKKESGIYTRI